MNRVTVSSVEHDQHVLSVERARQAFLDRLRPGTNDTDRLGDGWEHQIGIGQWRERNEGDPVGEDIECVVGDLNRQARLANTAGSGQGEQPNVRLGNRFQYGRDSVVTSNHGGQRLRWTFEWQRFDRPRHQAYRRRSYCT